MPTEIHFGDEAREKLKKGVNTLAEAVKATLGPKGQVVLLDHGFGSPAVTKDGVTVARSIDIPDRFEAMG